MAPILPGSHGDGLRPWQKSRSGNPWQHPVTGNRGSDGLRLWQNLVAGSVACSVEHVTMFPLDTAKTRMHPGSTRGHPIKSVRIGQALCSILKSEGPVALYRGSMGGLGAIWPSQAVVVSFHEICKESLLWLRRSYHPYPLYPEDYYTTGLFASLVSGALLGSFDMMLKQGGSRSLPSFVEQVFDRAPLMAVHIASYEVAKGFLMRRLPPPSSAATGGGYELWPIHATAGAAAGAAVPTLMALTRKVLDLVEAGRGKRSHFEDHLRKIVENDGYKRLMLRGWMPRIICHMPAGAIFWSTYEASKALLFGANDYARQRRQEQELLWLRRGA